MKIEQTERGFNIIEFEDRYDQKCSLQMSSLASESAIWLGVHNTGPSMKGPSDQFNEHISNRMHLTQAQVKALLPYLKRFVKTGEIGE